MERVSIKHDDGDKGSQALVTRICVAAVLVLIGVMTPWGRVPGMNPVTHQPNPILFGWTQGLAWLAMVDAILLVALSRIEVEGKQVFQRYALSTALGALCAYIGVLKAAGPESASMWWPAFIISLAMLGVGLAPDAMIPSGVRRGVLIAGLIVVVGLLGVLAAESLAIGQVLLVVGGFLAYLANVGPAKAGYPEYKRLCEEERGRIGLGI
jgi:hypothetical protein